jgi:hypothetical protein
MSTGVADAGLYGSPVVSSLKHETDCSVFTTRLWDVRLHQHRFMLILVKFCFFFFYLLNDTIRLWLYNELLVETGCTKILWWINWALRSDGVSGNGSIPPRILNRGNGWRWVRSFTSQGKEPQSTHWPQSGSGRCREKCFWSLWKSNPIIRSSRP